MKNKTTFFIKAFFVLCTACLSTTFISINSNEAAYADSQALNQELIIDDAYVETDFGTYICIETTVNEQYRELYIQFSGENIDGVHSLNSETIVAYDSCFMGAGYNPFYSLDELEVTITDLGNDTHSVIGSFTCQEGSFSFDTTVDYPSSGTSSDGPKRLTIDNTYIETGLSIYAEFDTVVNNEFRRLCLTLNAADSIDGNFSLSDESIIAYDAGLFDYTYELCNNLKSCELTIVDNGNDTHTCICSFEFDDESFFFSTIITFESLIGECEPVTITDYVLDDYCIEDSILYLLLEGTLDEKEVELEYKICSNKLEGIYSVADGTLDSIETGVYCYETKEYLPATDIILAIVDCGDGEYSVNSTFIIDETPFNINLTINYGSGLIYDSIDVTPISYTIEEGFVGQSIVFIDENDYEYDFMIMTSAIKSGVIYNLEDMYKAYTGCYLGDATFYEAKEASFKFTQNDDGSQKVEASMKIDTGKIFNITYTKEHSSKIEHDKIAPTCTTDGSKAYYECACGKYFEDEDCTIEIGDAEALAAWLTTEDAGLVAKTGHKMKFDSFVWDGFTAKAKYVCENANCNEIQMFDATVTNAITTEATCENKGVKTYTATYESNTDTKTEDIAAKGHTLTLVKGAASTCETEGYENAYKCSECNKYFKDADGKQVIGDEAAYNAWKVGEGKIAAKGHNLTKTEGEKATKESDGYKDAWKCANCNKYYSDEKGTNLIGDLAAFEAWKAGEGKINKIEPSPKENPKGCSSSILGASAIVSTLAIAGAILVSSKRKED